MACSMETGRVSGPFLPAGQSSHNLPWYQRHPLSYRHHHCSLLTAYCAALLPRIVGFFDGPEPKEISNVGSHGLRGPRHGGGGVDGSTRALVRAGLVLGSVVSACQRRVRYLAHKVSIRYVLGIIPSNFWTSSSSTRDQRMKPGQPSTETMGKPWTCDPRGGTGETLNSRGHQPHHPGSRRIRWGSRSVVLARGGRYLVCGMRHAACGTRSWEGAVVLLPMMMRPHDGMNICWLSSCLRNGWLSASQLISTRHGSRLRLSAAV